MNKDWEIKKLCELGNIFSGNSINEKEKKSYMDLSKKGLFYVATKDISTDSEIEYENGILIPDECLSKFKIAHKDSVLICAEGGSAGKKLAYNSEYDICFVNKLFAFESKNSIFPKFVFYYYQSSDFSKHFKNRLAGLIGGVSLQKFKEIQCPVPPLEEQKRIVKILDEKFTQLEKIKTNAQTNLQNAKDLFQSQLAKAFSNTTWEKKRLQDCTSIIGDGLHGTPKYDENGNYYFINGSNLTITDIVFTPETKRVNETEYQKYKVELNENTVFLSINGSTLGKRTAFYNNEPVILGKSACYINVKSNTLNKYYLRHFFNSDIFQEYAWKEKTGAAIPNLGLKAMRDLKIPLPPLPEQKRIVEQLDSLSEKTKALQNIYEQMLLDCEELKQGFLCKAFAGEL